MSQTPLNLLCIEPRFPGRLGPVADWLVRKRGYRCWCFFHSAEPQEFWPHSVGRGLELIHFNVGGAAREASVAWTRCLERGLCYAYGCWEVLETRRPRPIDLVLGRSAGLGSTLFVPAHAAGLPIVNYFDYFHHPRRHDLAEELVPELPASYVHWRQAANGMDLLDLENGIHPWTASRWQRDLYPPEYRDDFTVLPDGVDDRAFTDRPQRPPLTVMGRTIGPDVQLVTFVASALDRLRGFDRFRDLADRLLRARSDVVCVAVGNPLVQRSLDVPWFNRDYRAALLQQSPVHDPERFWCPGPLPPPALAALLARSDLHVYASRAYPVSRSLLLALAAGRVVLAWDTEPVREVLTHGTNALLTADPDQAATLAAAALADPAAHRPLGDAARQLALTTHTHDAALPRLAAWFQQLVERGVPMS
ncbi:MAG: glycosyltransferase [Planctomycetia bacterium]|nr:glycosyltransferase [Planctomycetia bacterium]